MKMSKGEFIQAMADHLYDTLGEDDSQDVIQKWKIASHLEHYTTFSRSLLMMAFGQFEEVTE